MTTHRRPMATRRGPQWAPEHGPSWGRDWAKALLLLLVILACGINEVRW